MLATGPEAEEALALGAERFGAPRLKKLLARGFLLSQAVEPLQPRHSFFGDLTNSPQKQFHKNDFDITPLFLSS